MADRARPISQSLLDSSHQVLAEWSDVRERYAGVLRGRLRRARNYIIRTRGDMQTAETQINYARASPEYGDVRTYVALRDSLNRRIRTMTAGFERVRGALARVYATGAQQISMLLMRMDGLVAHTVRANGQRVPIYGSLVVGQAGTVTPRPPSSYWSSRGDRRETSRLFPRNPPP